MPQHMYREIERLKKKILSLSALVEESLRSAIKCIETRNVALARSAIDADPLIDEMEVEVEEECLKALALYQPVAADLRYIIIVLKINNDLERIGDLAVNIAEESIRLSALPAVDPPFDLDTMSEKVHQMVSRSLDCLINLDGELARQICASDDDVDNLYRDMFPKVRETAHRQPEVLQQMIHYMEVSHNLERIADHATNIAEDIIYMIKGNIVRHKVKTS